MNKKTKMAKLLFACAVVLTASMSVVGSPAIAATTVANSNPNLIANPSLEVGVGTTPQNWLKRKTGTNTTAFTYPVMGYLGGRGIRVKTTAYTNGEAGWYFNPVAVAAGNYEFIDYYKSNAASYVVAEFTSSTAGTTVSNLLTLDANGTTSYKKASVVFTVPSGTSKVTIYHVIRGVGTLDTDTYSLKSTTSTPTTPTDPVPPTTENLVANPSFETAGDNGLPANWSQGGWGAEATFSYPAAGFDGKNAAEVDVTSYSGGDAKWYFDDVTVKSNYIYAFSDYYNADAASYLVARFTSTSDAVSYVDLATLPATGGWKQFGINLATPTDAKSMTIFHLLRSTGKLAVDEYSLSEKGSASFDAGMVSLDFDDGWRSAFLNAVPVFNAAGFKTTQYIVTDFMNNDPYDYCTPLEVQAMQSMGNEIGSHSKTHPDMFSLTADQLQLEVAQSKADLAAIGIDAKTFAYPYDQYNDTVMTAIKSAGYSGARASDSGFNTKDRNPYLLITQSVEKTTTFAQIKAWIDSAKANKTWLILLFHQVDNDGGQYSTTPAMISNISAYLTQTRMPVVTNYEGIQKLTK